MNHLIDWQESQLLALKHETPENPITELETWIESGAPFGQNEIDKAVAIFNAQLVKIKTIVSTLS